MSGAIIEHTNMNFSARFAAKTIRCSDREYSIAGWGRHNFKKVSRFVGKCRVVINGKERNVFCDTRHYNCLA